MKIYKSKSSRGFLRYHKKQLTLFKQDYIINYKLGFEIKINNVSGRCVLFYEDRILIATSQNSKGEHWKKKNERAF